MMNDISISVIIPTYKPKEYLYKCLDTLSKQTLSLNKFEIIIVLNGDKEPYFNQIENYISRLQLTNTKLLYTETSGVSNARNTGIDASCGDYITFIDDDDYVTPDYLQSLLNKADTDIITVSNIIAIDDSTGEQESCYLTDAFQHIKGKEKASLPDARSFMSPVGGKLISRSTIGNSRFPLNFKLGEDSLFMFDISRNVNYIVPTAEETKYYYTTRQNSASRQNFTYLFRVRLAFRMICAFTKLWLKAPTKYNFPFFLTRIASQLRKLTQKVYQ